MIQTEKLAQEASFANSSLLSTARKTPSHRASVEKAAPRPGRTRTITDRRVKKVVEMTLQQKPGNATHWSTRTMAAAAGISSKELIIATRKTNEFPCALENINADSPSPMSRLAQIRDLQQMQFPTEKHIMSDCNKIEITLAGGSDNQTIYREALGFEIDEAGAMRLIKI